MCASMHVCVETPEKVGTHIGKEFGAELSSLNGNNDNNALIQIPEW